MADMVLTVCSIAKTVNTTNVIRLMVSVWKDARLIDREMDLSVGHVRSSLQ